MVSPSASGFLPGMQGLHTAVVKKTVIKEWLNGQNSRIAAGSFFLPEPGDEVVIGFMNEDPTHPIILSVKQRMIQKQSSPVKRCELTNEEKRMKNEINGKYINKKEIVMDIMLKISV